MFLGDLFNRVVIRLRFEDLFGLGVYSAPLLSTFVFFRVLRVIRVYARPTLTTLYMRDPLLKALRRATTQVLQLEGGKPPLLLEGGSTTGSSPGQGTGKGAHSREGPLGPPQRSPRPKSPSKPIPVGLGVGLPGMEPIARPILRSDLTMPFTSGSSGAVCEARAGCSKLPPIAPKAAAALHPSTEI
jgi:hypothetical protein